MCAAPPKTFLRSNVDENDEGFRSQRAHISVIPTSHLTRRDFCRAAGAVVAVAACQSGNGQMVETGGLDDGGQAHPTTDGGAPPQRDSGTRPLDGGVTQVDAAVVGGNCPAGVTMVGAASSFVAGSPTYFSSGRFFVVRDAQGLYALTAICTHAGCTVSVRSGSFYCPCHRATFSFNGDAVSGPVFSPLVHYPVCSLGGGMVGVDRAHTVSASVRLAV